MLLVAKPSSKVTVTQCRAQEHNETEEILAQFTNTILNVSDTTDSSVTHST
jgi:hypothetical protein